MALGKNCRDNEGSWTEGVVGFVRRRGMDAEVARHARSVSSGWSGWPPFLTAEWSYNGRHASSRAGIERMPSRSRREENSAVVQIYPEAPGIDRSRVTVGPICSEVLEEFPERIEELNSWDSGWGSTGESATESVWTAKR